jgi:ABC-type phosphate/phosphonate transport system substrate-binding protein
MYDWPEVAAANDALWSAIAARLRDAGIAAPAGLDRARPPEAVWRDPGLVLSQTCGFPFSTRLRGIVRLVGAPIHDVRGCAGPHYSSLIVARGDAADDLAAFEGRRFAYNSEDSLSGYRALVAALKGKGIDPARAEWLETGSHRASIRAVAAGAADIAAIDAICWALARRHEPDITRRLKVVAETPLRPALPFITAVERSDAEVATIRAALAAALADPATAEARTALGLVGLGTLNDWDYAPIAFLGRAAA